MVGLSSTVMSPRSSFHFSASPPHLLPSQLSPHSPLCWQTACCSSGLCISRFHTLEKKIHFLNYWKEIIYVECDWLYLAWFGHMYLSKSTNTSWANGWMTTRFTLQGGRKEWYTHDQKEEEEMPTTNTIVSKVVMNSHLRKCRGDRREL